MTPDGDLPKGAVAPRGSAGVARDVEPSAPAGRGQAPADPLREVEALLAELDHPFIVFDGAGSVLSMNPAALELHGYTAVAECRRPLAQLAEDLEVRDAEGRRLPVEEWPFSRAIRGEVVRALELRVTRIGAGRSWTALHTAARLGASRERPLFVLSIDDVTAWRDAEQALRDSAALYRSLFTLAPSGVVLNDHRGRIRAFNDQAHQQLGYTREEFSRLEIADIDPDERPEDVRAHITRIAIEGGSEYEVHHRTKSGDVRDVLVRTRPVAIGGEQAYLNVWQDITERKRVEAAVREADRRKDDFLAVLSHELRNPLAPLRSAVWLLQRAEPGGERAARAAEIIERQVSQLTRLVDDLLDVTRVSRGKIELRRTRVDLVALARAALDDHAPLFRAREIVPRVDLPREPLWIEADGPRIGQVLGNLLSNACKFTRVGGHVELAIEPAGESAVVRVRDDGVGIPAELLGRVFEPFVQGDASLGRSRGGLGLGLALVKTLVELHRGSVSVRSDGKDLGAELRITLPLAGQPAREGRRTPTPVPQGGFPRRRVLVIEDNLDAAETLHELLLISGQEVEVAHDGAEGVDKARAFRPDLVLCDVGLPTMDGYEVARAIRSDPGLASAFLVALTGYALPEDRRRAFEAGFQRHLGKPVSVEQIEEILATAPVASR